MLAVAAPKKDGGKIRTAGREFKPVEHSASPFVAGKLFCVPFTVENPKTILV